jgi:hypothetical protein
VGVALQAFCLKPLRILILNKVCCSCKSRFISHSRFRNTFIRNIKPPIFGLQQLLIGDTVY